MPATTTPAKGTDRPTDRRAARRQERVDAMVDAALAVLTEEGFEALTMQRLASELGYAVGAAYRYFKGKDELLLAVQLRVLSELAADIDAAVASVEDSAAPEVDALLRVLAAAEAYRGLPERRPAHFRLLARWLGRPEPMVADAAAAPVVSPRIALFERVPRLLALAVAAGALQPGDPLGRTYVLWASVHGVLQLAKLARFGIDALSPGALGASLLETLLAGWGADEETRGRALARWRETDWRRAIAGEEP